MKLLIFFIYLASFVALEQKDTVYMDENNIKISKTLYKTKLKNTVLHSKSYETDSLMIYKILHKYYFGKISSKEYNQIRLLLEKEDKTKIKDNNPLLIKYYDTLFDFKTLMNQHKLHLKKHHLYPNGDTIKNIKHHTFNHKIYLRKIKEYSKKSKKCTKKLGHKMNTKVFYVYNFDKGYVFNENLKWIKDKIFKNLFFKIMHEYDLIIIKPNGDYFLKSGHFSDANIKLLLKENNWSSFIDDWKNSLTKYPINGTGIIKKFNQKSNPLNHINHCF